MTKVNAILIGAGRSGTTSLYHYLKEHQSICFSSIKEVHYFSIKDLYKRGEEYYHYFFSECRENQKWVSADTYLLVDKKAPKRIFSYNPEMKIIVILRDPVDRAYSSYLYAINNGYEKKNITFQQTLELEKERLITNNIVEINNLCHFYGSLYYYHIRYWMQYFPKENFFILKTSELKNEPEKILQKLASFLNIKPFKNVVENKEKHKAAGSRSKSLQQFLLNRNHPLRKFTRPIAKPLKSVILKSGLINLLYKLNRKKNTLPELTESEKKNFENYFSEDLKNLNEEFGISF
jgi:hypothetical protein